ncbi:MAG: AAA family ATPase [Blastocatellia bacterium]|nr:AAA family ATPase [Blastocatellia bacterium]
MLPIITLITELENETLLAQALLFPELVRVESRASRVIGSLKQNVKRLLADTPPLYAHHRRHAGEVERFEYELVAAPPAKSPLWRTPVQLRFRGVRWMHGDAAAIAFLPTLGIEIVSTKAATMEALDRIIAPHIRAELARRGAGESLARLVWLQREIDLRIAADTVELDALTPRQIASRQNVFEEKKRSALAEAATDLTTRPLPVAYEMEAVVAQMAEALSGKSPRSVLLVGPSGVGKTAAVFELIRRRADFQFAHTPFYATNGSRLVAGMSGFGQWQERCRQLWQEAAQQRAILYFGNLVELMEVGKYVGNEQGIADFLRPFIARGDALVIAECTPEQAAHVDRANRKMLDIFQQIKVEEPTAERRRGVLLGYALADTVEKGNDRIHLEALERIDQLHQRYAGYSASPGRPVRFLRNLLQDHETERELQSEDVIRAFSKETGLPRLLLSEDERMEPESVREWFASRVVGQPDAVHLIVDLLATVKAGLTRPRKPIASLLFIGPTGVGKTEMAKALAEFLFQDRGRMVRFDMSEYADPLAVTRLVGGVFGKEGLLTAQVREQPFSVVLLDELEKADPSFFDLLLQVLGEGRLTDAMGRVADFSNSVVIMTSNLGAQSFQRGLVGFGEANATREAAARHFTNAVRQAMRPEMFNRIDRIVPFAPLDEATVLRIAEREIEKIRHRDGLRFRDVVLKIDDEVTRHLARRGYDPRYGARPLKRAIERELVAPLSVELCQVESNEVAEIAIRVEADHLSWHTRKVAESAAAQTQQQNNRPKLLALSCQLYRRRAQKLERSAALRNLQNEIFSLERLEKRVQTSKWKNPQDLAGLEALPQLKKLRQTIADFCADINQVEADLLLQFYGKKTIDLTQAGVRVDALSNRWNRILTDLYALRIKNPDVVTLAIYGESPRRLFELAELYHSYAKLHDRKISLCYFIHKAARPSKKKEPTVAALQRIPVETPAKFFAAPIDGVAAILLGIQFPQAFLKLELERGLHIFIAEKKQTRCLVETSQAAFDSYQPVLRKLGPTASYEKRRTYNEDLPSTEDHLLNRKLQRGSLTDVMLAELIDRTLMLQAEAMID